MSNQTPCCLSTSRAGSNRAVLQQMALARLALDRQIVDGDLSLACQHIAEVLATTAEVARASVWKFTEDEAELQCLALYEGATGTQGLGAALHLAAAPRYFMEIRQASRVITVDAQNDPRTSELASLYLIPLGITAILDSAIRVGGKLKGIVRLEHIGDKRDWHPDEEAFADAVATIAAQAFLHVDRTLAEEKLRASEKQFRALFVDSPVSIIVHDRETGEIIDANPKACAMYGFSSVAELQANEFWMGPPYSFAEALAWIRKAAREGMQQFEWLNRKGNGELFWEQVHLSPVIINGIERILAITIDITAQKRTEELLRRQDALLQAAAAASHVLLAEKDIDTAVRQALQLVGGATSQDRVYLFEYHKNPETDEKLMSRRYEWVREGVGRQIDNPTLQGLSFDLLFSRWFSLLSRGEAVAGAVRDFPEGEQAVLVSQDIVSLMVVPVQVDGRLWGFVGFDNCRIEYAWGDKEQAILTSLAASLGAAVTRHRAEEALRKSHASLELATRQSREWAQTAEVANKTKSHFLANMSHEIRTPMNAIIGMTYLVMNTELTDRQQEYIGQIQAAAKSLLRIINDILDFSKIEAGKVELERVVFRLEEVIAKALAMQRQMAQRKGIELLFALEKSSLAGEAGTFLGDPLRLEQIVTNLLTNAIKFTETGHVRLSVREVARTPSSCQLQLLFEDTGIGMTPAQVDGLFKDYSQVDGSTTRRHGGTGLGLSIARQLLSLMGGELSVESQVGIGTRFTCHLNLDRPDLPALPEKNPQFPGLPGMRVLLVEDNLVNQQIAMEMLAYKGVIVDVANNGREALDILQGKPDDCYHAVLLDIEMPILDGYQTVKLLRAQSRWANVPVIAMTAHAMTEEKQRCLVAGMDGHLTKPFKLEDLLQTLAPYYPQAVLMHSRGAGSSVSAPELPEVSGDAVKLLQHLRELLAESDSAAIDFWKEHKEMLCPVLTEVIAEQLSLAIAGFRFDEALVLLVSSQG